MSRLSKTAVCILFPLIPSAAQTVASAAPESVGRFSRGSACYSLVDPQEKLEVFLLTQLIPAGSAGLNDCFRYLVYQAIMN